MSRYPQGHQKAQALHDAIGKLIRSEVIIPFPTEERFRGYYSNLFVVPKKDGSVRPILDLKELHTFIRPRRFKLESLRPSPWPELGPSCLYQDHVGGHCSNPHQGDLHNSLSGRSPDQGTLICSGPAGVALHHGSITGVWLVHQPGQVLVNPKPIHGLPLDAVQHPDTNSPSDKVQHLRTLVRSLLSKSHTARFYMKGASVEYSCGLEAQIPSPGISFIPQDSSLSSLVDANQSPDQGQTPRGSTMVTAHHRCKPLRLGSSAEGRSAQGRWSLSEQCLHINLLEIQAIRLACQPSSFQILGLGSSTSLSRGTLASHPGPSLSGSNPSPLSCHPQFDGVATETAILRRKGFSDTVILPCVQPANRSPPRRTIGSGSLSIGGANEGLSLHMSLGSLKSQFSALPSCSKDLSPCSQIGSHGKQFFLLAIASARRVSEISALSCRSPLLTFHNDRAVLHTSPSFLPKVVSTFHLNQEITIPTFCPSLSNAKEAALHTLDPVRALKFYLHRVEDIRLSDSLSLDHHILMDKAGHPEILFITGSGSPRSIGAHSARGLFENKPQRNKAATWTSIHTFAKFYQFDTLWHLTPTMAGRYFRLQWLVPRRPLLPALDSGDSFGTSPLSLCPPSRPREKEILCTHR
ncbi:unnamed protein product [Protopolystoma xenopodis]|uniref:Uncharacterized protein n=1 Tax=Protopolystoma xenopodis TaxID=117903 RepID=A0A3S5CFU6_9PLAT|nr:unnamed protein product [Protopolystoma xenopodis]